VGEEAVVDVGAAFPAFGEASELVEQGKCLLDDPADRLVVVPCAVPADQGPDPNAGVTGSGTCRVDLAPVSHDNIRFASWTSAPTTDRRHVSSIGISWVMSLRFLPVSVTASGIPPPSQIR
jgi:hypothetical protein